MRRFLAGKSWKIVVVDDISEYFRECHGEKHSLANEALFGCADDETSTIALDGTQPQRFQASTLLHEMLHVALPNLSETKVRLLEEILFPVLWRDGWRPDLEGAKYVVKSKRAPAKKSKRGSRNRHKPRK